MKRIIASAVVTKNEDLIRGSNALKKRNAQIERRGARDLARVASREHDALGRGVERGEKFLNQALPARSFR
jgi:hypothetical protein